MGKEGRREGPKGRGMKGVRGEVEGVDATAAASGPIWS